VAVIAKAPIHSPVAKSVEQIMFSIDATAGVLTGDPQALWLKGASTPKFQDS
jgi:hypothetical protein